MKVSRATENNWKKLNVNNRILDARANKTMSKKRIVPKELFENKDNINAVSEIIQNLPKNNVKNVMYSLCINLLIHNNLLDENLNTKNPYINKFIKDSHISVDKDLVKISLPDEADILGIIYQCLQTEGKKNIKGSYYTPKTIIKDMVNMLEITEESRILDPCCGTGAYLLNIETTNPKNLYGVDIDPIAVMIAKTNLFIKYKNQEFEPQIYVKDFIKTNMKLSNFDFIVTNVPWGAYTTDINSNLYSEILTGESFSYFIVKASKMLKQNGKLNFLLPESFINVKSHEDIRRYVIENMTLENITIYPDNFSGVVTKATSIVARNEKNENYKINLNNQGEKFETEKERIKKNFGYVITFENDIDRQIQNKVARKKFKTLENSIWAIGIVTGDNKNKLKKEAMEGYEPIYTGKEIAKYNLLPCKNYVIYDRNTFQQVAPDWIFRAPEKLVYKFISKRITVAYDKSQHLYINSANILIPNIEGMNIKTVMAFLNSTLFQYLYIKKFGEIKILKGNLSQLPFPEISENEDKQFVELVDKVLNGQNAIQDIENKIYKMYEFTRKEIEYMERITNGKSKSNIE